MYINKNDLGRIFGKLKGIVPRKSTLDVMKGILINHGRAVSSNGDVTIISKLPEAEEDYFMIPESAFELLLNLPDGEVNITSDDNNVLTIQTETINTKVKSYDPNQYGYDKNEMDDIPSMHVDGDKIMQLFNHVVFAADEKCSNVTMNGVNLVVKDGQITATGSDGHMIATDFVKIDGDKEQGIDMNVIIPKSAVKTTLSIGMVGDTRIQMNGASIMFANDETAVYTRLIAGAYPNMAAIFDIDCDREVNFSRKEFGEAVRRAKRCRENSLEGIALDLGKEECVVRLQSNTISYGENIPMHSTRYPGEDMTIGISPDLLMQVMKAMGGYTIKCAFSKPLNPVLLWDNDSYMKALILPINMH